MKLLVVLSLALSLSALAETNRPAAPKIAEPVVDECGSLNDAITSVEALRELTSLKGDNQNALFNHTARVKAYLYGQKLKVTKSKKERENISFTIETLCEQLD